MKVFVTVGTTSFDALCAKVASEQILLDLKNLGYTEVTVQTGLGWAIEKTEMEGIRIESYDFKASLQADMEAADLIISHAGAGSILETLGKNKPLIVVINERLMDNHQWELATQLEVEGHLFATTPSMLHRLLQTIDVTKLAPYPAPDPVAFGGFLDSLMGFAA